MNSLVIKENEKSQQMFKDVLVLISTILGILVVLLTGFTLIYQFLVYLFELQWFNYWDINETFYNKSNTDIINSLLYGFFTICLFMLLILAMRGITNSQSKENKMRRLKIQIQYFLIYAVCYSLFALKDFYRYGLNIYLVFIHIIILVITLFVMKYYAKKANMFIENIKNKEKYLLKDILLDFLILVISVFVVTIIMGNVNAWVKRDYPIIKNDTNCNVLLYSADNYYIIAECEINDKDLIVYKNTQRKIDNYNVIYKWEKFENVKKKS